MPSKSLSVEYGLKSYKVKSNKVQDFWLVHFFENNCFDWFISLKITSNLEVDRLFSFILVLLKNKKIKKLNILRAGYLTLGLKGGNKYLAITYVNE